ncbi:MAG: UvrD-helicase domain-containing protein [Clostridia bacterium]|nr:UvrD-helicase domain-containing protein [Clostridia bacterium]
MAEEILLENTEKKEERVWTPMQARAIAERKKTLLVSAGAGSGKTAVLTERILTSILDKNDPVDIQDMLIVTYTRLAAGELRDRIGKEIKDRLEEDPGNTRLEAQLRMLPGARICTIDAFCSELVRQYPERLGLTPAFRVPDSAEAELVAEQLLDGMLSEMYEGRLPEVASPAEIAEACDALTDNGRQADLSVILRMLYSTTRNAYEGVEAIAPLVEEYDPERFVGVERTGLGGYAIERLREMCGHYRSVYRSMLCEMEGLGGAKVQKIRAMLAEDIDFLDRVITACDGSYDELRELIRNRKQPSSVSNTDPSLPPTTHVRAEFKKRLEKMDKDFFFAESGHWRIVYRDLYRILSTLMRVLRHFDRLYRQEKIRIGIADFADLERYAYELLWQDGELTDIARLQRETYRAVYIDEYQDVNSLQDKIFRAITSPSAGFMVGDIKQSIYKFRSAAADIFAAMKREYPEISSSEGSEVATIYMSDNFRCDAGVIDFVNSVFDKIFYHLRKCIEYVPEDRLVSAKYRSRPECEPPYRRPELCLINLAPLNDRNKSLGQGRVNPDKATATLVAEKIAELLESGRLNDGRPIKPEHIAIIIRKARGRAEIYRDALAEKDIPAVLAERTQFFTNPTILLALSLLNSIDNPSKDIYLAALMLSPLYKFTPDELSAMRAEGGFTLYASLLRYVEKHPEFEKGVKFAEDIARYRLLAEGTPTDVLLIRLYHETGLLSLGAREGSKDQLMRLYESARSFEHSSFKGLYNFINYINSITARNNSMDKREAPKAEAEVSIITAHGSKGLEFPVVFFVSPEQGIGGGGGEMPTRFEYVEHFGIGLPTRTEGGLALVRNSTRPIIKEYSRRAEVEEMSRVLYVILTRARERLYIVGTSSKDTEKLLEESAIDREYLSDYSVYELTSPLKMLLASRDIDVIPPAAFVERLPEALSPDCEGETLSLLENGGKLDTGSTQCREYTPLDVEKLKQRFTFEYPREYMTELPEKMAVSVLYPRVLDGLEDDGIEKERAALRFPGLNVLPEFMGGEESDSSAKRGISTHLFMQFFDIESLINNGLEFELHRLEALGFLSAKDVERIFLGELELFIKSDLLALMRGGVRLYRELRFNVKLPAEMFTETEEGRTKYAGEEILVQGVIDCIIEDEDGALHLVDYKTDRLTRAEEKSYELTRKKMNDAHSEQLSYYSEAIYRMFGRRPVTVQVYSTVLGRLVDIDTSVSFDKK